MAENQQLADLLAQFEVDLAEVCGADLSESLLKAGQSGGVMNLDMQLAINDGLEMIDEEKRALILGMLDDFLNRAKSLRAEE